MTTACGSTDYGQDLALKSDLFRAMKSSLLGVHNASNLWYTSTQQRSGAERGDKHDGMCTHTLSWEVSPWQTLHASGGLWFIAVEGYSDGGLLTTTNDGLTWVNQDFSSIITPVLGVGYRTACPSPVINPGAEVVFV